MNDSEYLAASLLFPANLDEELKTYSSISNKNLETFCNMADFICSKLDGNAWKNLENLNNCYNSIVKQINHLGKQISSIQNNIQIFNKKYKKELKNTEDIKDIIDECIKQHKKLTLDKEEAHKAVINKHNALKHAISYYKNGLDLYIHVEMEENMLKIKVCLFTKKFNDKYSVFLYYNTTENIWKLLETNPILPDFQYSALQKRLNDTNNVSALILTVREMFKKYIWDQSLKSIALY